MEVSVPAYHAIKTCVWSRVKSYEFLEAPDAAGQFYEPVTSLLGKESFVLI